VSKKIVRNIIIICTFLLLVIIINLISNNKKQAKENKLDNTIQSSEDINISEQINKEEVLEKKEDRSTVFALKSTVEDYIHFVHRSSNNLSMIDPSYDGSVPVLGNYSSKFVISEFYSYANEKQTMYFIKGNYVTIENSSATIDLGYFKLTVDSNNYTYVAKPITETEYNNRDKINVNEIIEIEQGKYNGFIVENMDEETAIKKYVEDFMYYAKNAPQYAFDNLLESSYRESKFANVDSFIAYVNNLNIGVNTFIKKEYDGFVEYVVQDTQNNRYVLKEFENCQYKIKLDDYTIASTQESENYKAFSEEEKVSYCVKNFLEKLNDQDYVSAYASLPKGYRNTNFPTLESFEQYIKVNFYEKNIFSQATVKVQDGVYVADVIIKSGVSTKAQKQTKTFYVQLNENMSYILSFQY